MNMGFSDFLINGKPMKRSGTLHSTLHEFYETMEEIQEAESTLREETLWEIVNKGAYRWVVSEIDSSEAAYQYYVDTVKEVARKEHTNIEAAKRIVLSPIVRHIEDRVKECGTLDGKDVWRIIYLSKKIDPTTLNNVGIFWSLDSQMRNMTSSNRSQIGWRFRARLDIRYALLTEVLGANIWGLLADVESDVNEIRFISGSPIYIYSVERLTGCKENCLISVDKEMKI